MTGLLERRVAALTARLNLDPILRETTRDFEGVPFALVEGAVQAEAGTRRLTIEADSVVILNTAWNTSLRIPL